MMRVVWLESMHARGGHAGWWADLLSDADFIYFHQPSAPAGCLVVDLVHCLLPLAPSIS
uniref:Uncharacterized protein n=2 Tax=Setaria TaxID=4554 RepID=K3ZG73_SETIT